MKNKSLQTVYLPVILILFILALSVALPASSDHSDSLKTIIDSNPEGKSKADALFNLAKYFVLSNEFDSAMIYNEQALSLSTGLNHTEGTAGSLYLRSVILKNKGYYQEALIPSRDFIRLAKQLNDESELGKGYYHHSDLLNTHGETDSAIYYIYESLKINFHLNDSVRILACFNSLGSIFMGISEYDSAFYYYMKSAEFAGKTGKEQYLGSIYHNMGKTLFKLDDTAEAKKYFRMSEKITRKNHDLITLSLNLIHLGIIYSNNRDYARSLEYYNQADEILESLDNKMIMADLFNNFATVYESEKKYEAALFNYDRALEAYQQEHYSEGIIVASMNKGRIYTMMGKYDLARTVLHSSLDSAVKAGYRNNQMLILLHLAKNYYASGDFKKAYDYYDMHANLYDSIYTLAKSEIINDLKQKYERGKDEARILSLEKESLKKTIQRNTIFYGSMALLMVAIYGFLVFRHRLVKSRLLSQQKIRQLEEREKLMAAGKLVEGQEAERKRIAQELHDGLGVLLSATKMQLTQVMEKIPTSMPLMDKAIHLVEQSSKEARRISHNMMPGLLTKLGLFEAVEDLIDNINDIGKIQAYFEIKGEPSRLSENTEIMIYRIIQEMVNNTLKYAQATRIDLSIMISNPLMAISYKDDGIGFDVEAILISGKRSLGLKSIESRVGFLNGELKIDSAPGKGVNYLIKIPV